MRGRGSARGTCVRGRSRETDRVCGEGSARVAGPEACAAAGARPPRLWSRGPEVCAAGGISAADAAPWLRLRAGSASGGGLWRAGVLCAANPRALAALLGVRRRPVRCAGPAAAVPARASQGSAVMSGKEGAGAQGVVGRACSLVRPARLSPRCRPTPVSPAHRPRGQPLSLSLGAALLSELCAGARPGRG